MNHHSARRFAIIFTAAATAAVAAPQARAQEYEKTREQRQELREARRLDKARQQQLILEQQRRNQLYKTYLQRQELSAQRQATQYERAQQLARYRYQQQYLQQLQNQRLALARSYDYNNDPYYYTAPTYRYTRGGRTYQTNQYGAEALQQAINYGYQQGVQAGQADRSDGYRGDYRKTYAYQDASYGYSGRYVNQTDYSYYFRQGFQRGYTDGFNGRLQYGTQNGGTLGILSSVLGTILNLAELN